MVNILQNPTPRDLSIAVVLLYTVVGWLVPLGIKLGYGRLKNSVVKFELPPRLAWFLFEVPNLIWALYFLVVCQDGLSLGYGLFILHYINRDIIYPLRMRSTNKVPIEIVLSAASFTFANGYLQGLCNRNINETPSHNAFIRVIGIAVFCVGMYINIRSDEILQSTRAKQPKKTQNSEEEGKKHNYVTINEFLFKYVSNPNYLGQIIEWLGYFLVCQNLESFLFFFSTLNILVAGAIPRNKWNKQNLPDYPQDRKAVIPFLI